MSACSDINQGTCNPLPHNPLIFSLHKATQQVIGQHTHVALPVAQVILIHYVGKVQVTCMTSRISCYDNQCTAAATNAIQATKTYTSREVKVWLHVR